jgi:hypothetical protein
MKLATCAALAVLLFFPLPTPAGSAFNGAATNPGMPPYGGFSKFHTNPGGKYVYRGYSAWRSR